MIFNHWNCSLTGIIYKKKNHWNSEYLQVPLILHCWLLQLPCPGEGKRTFLTPPFPSHKKLQNLYPTTQQRNMAPPSAGAPTSTAQGRVRTCSSPGWAEEPFCLRTEPLRAQPCLLWPARIHSHPTPLVLERMKGGQVQSPSPSFPLGHPKGSTEGGDPSSMPRVPQPGRGEQPPQLTRAQCQDRSWSGLKSKDGEGTAWLPLVKRINHSEQSVFPPELFF